MRCITSGANIVHFCNPELVLSLSASAVESGFFRRRRRLCAHTTRQILLRLNRPNLIIFRGWRDATLFIRKPRFTA
jgi:hypothetical protein